MTKKWSIFFIVFQVAFACSSSPPVQQLESTESAQQDAETVLGNERLSEYLPLIEGKKVGFVGNHTSRIGGIHLVDSFTFIEH